jgi:hypothetical protein
VTHDDWQRLKVGSRVARGSTLGTVKSVAEHQRWIVVTWGGSEFPELLRRDAAIADFKLRCASGNGVLLSTTDRDVIIPPLEREG